MPGQATAALQCRRTHFQLLSDSRSNASELTGVASWFRCVRLTHITKDLGNPREDATCRMKDFYSSSNRLASASKYVYSGYSALTAPQNRADIASAILDMPQ